MSDGPFVKQGLAHMSARARVSNAVHVSRRPAPSDKRAGLAWCLTALRGGELHNPCVKPPWASQLFGRSQPSQHTACRRTKASRSSSSRVPILFGPSLADLRPSLLRGLVALRPAAEPLGVDGFTGDGAANARVGGLCCWAGLAGAAGCGDLLAGGTGSFGADFGACWGDVWVSFVFVDGGRGMGLLGKGARVGLRTHLC